jgi:hypothetical protein
MRKAYAVCDFLSDANKQMMRSVAKECGFEMGFYDSNDEAHGNVADAEVAYMLPVFDFDGEKHTSVCVSEKSITVEYDGWVCIYETDGKIANTGTIGCNRNGHYKAYYAYAEKQLSVNIRIESR